MKTILIIITLFLLLLILSFLVSQKQKNTVVNLVGITTTSTLPVFPLNNLNFQFVTPFFNNRKILLSSNYNITEITALHTTFSGWSGSLLGKCYGSLLPCSNVIITPGVNQCDTDLNCYPSPVGQYSFETYINDIYIGNQGPFDQWDVNYNVLRTLKGITNIKDDNIKSDNFPYRIERIEISFAVDERGVKKLQGGFNIFKFNVIISQNDAEKIQAERLEVQRIEAERVEAERIKVEKRLEAEKRLKEAERIKAEKMEAEKIQARKTFYKYLVIGSIFIILSIFLTKKIIYRKFN